MAPALAESRATAAGPSRWPLLFSVLALGFSSAAFAIALRQAAEDPLAELGKPLGTYDRSTPWDALRSEPLIQCDLRAAFTYLRERDGEQIKEQLRTLKLHREEDFEGYKLLFVTHKEGDRTRYAVHAYQQNESNGLWFDDTLNFRRHRRCMCMTVDGKPLDSSSEQEVAIVKAAEEWEAKDEAPWRFQRVRPLE